jgi:branched-chain amino acid transport system substrate-binding protein
VFFLFGLFYIFKKFLNGGSFMKNGRKKLLSIALTSLLAIGLAGCGSKSESSNADKKEGGEIKIGANFELTGEISTYGTSAVNAIKLAFADINANGGVLGKQLVLVEKDNKSESTESTSVATALASEGEIVAILGPISSGNTMAASQPVIDNKIPLLTPTATNPDVTVDPKSGKVKEYIFRSCYLDSFQGKVTAEFAFNDLKAKKAVILIDNGNDYSKGLAKYFTENFEKAGGKVIKSEGFISKDNDFRAIITKIKDTKPDVIFVPAYYEAVGKIVKQARELGIDVPFIGTDGWDSPKLVEIAGKNALNNTYFSNHYTPEDTDPKVQTFVNAYKAKYNQTPDALAALAYDSAMLMADAITRAGVADPEKIKEALAATKGFAGVTGNVDLDANHNPIKSVVMIEMKDGKQTVNKKVQP